MLAAGSEAAPPDGGGDSEASEVLRFALAQRGGRVHEVTVRSGEVAFLGRGNRLAVVVNDSSVSTQHVEFTIGKPQSGEGSGRLCLLARDRSQNGTGVCKLGSDGLPDLAGLWRLSTDKPDILQDGHCLVVPLRRKGSRAGEHEVPEKSVYHIYLHPGPDAAAEWPPRPVPLAGNQGGAGGVGAVLPACVPDKTLETDNLPERYDPASGSGRWRYQARLGEGGLGVVYRAVDCTGGLGNVAIKVLKHPERAFWGKQHCFSMHRESQWSLQKLHNTADARYCASTAKLFARYLEDHTGLAELFPGDFDDRRRRFEAPGLDWEKDGPTIGVTQPYVVMELVAGEAMHVAIDRSWRPQRNKGPLPMTMQEKREVFLQAARALEYLATFGLIHRDFRGCNIHLEERQSETSGCRLKVLDLGVMITDEDWQQSNTNDAVQAFRKRGETEEKRRRYDWLPWEVRASADGNGPPLNFEKPIHSFDMFSLGVLALHLLIGRSQARELLGQMESGMVKGEACHESLDVDTTCLGLEPALLRQMLGPAAQRPTPDEVVKAIEVNHARPQSDANLMRPVRFGSTVLSQQRPNAEGDQQPFLGPEVTLSHVSCTRSPSPSLEPAKPKRPPPPAPPSRQVTAQQPPRLLPPGGHGAPKTHAPPFAAPVHDEKARTARDSRERSRSCSDSQDGQARSRRSSHRNGHMPASKTSSAAREQKVLLKPRRDRSRSRSDSRRLSRMRNGSRGRGRHSGRHRSSSREVGVWRRSSRRDRAARASSDPSEEDDDDGSKLFRRLRALSGRVLQQRSRARLPEGLSSCWILTFPLASEV
eukprot:TRINITY_DN26274_c0_g1_i1.p1 TRINITY_DN26274_c0_g1~~TRINITY_DN26274_c0_g1_i1.p1  ORF type:complete len:831 (-),score=119.94 TRINITY_DN26274_c0_g1_i1:46-2496(-)